MSRRPPHLVSPSKPSPGVHAGTHVPSTASALVGMHTEFESTAKQSKSLAQVRVHMPLAGPPPQNAFVSACMQLRPSPQSAFALQAMPRSDVSTVGEGVGVGVGVGRPVGTGVVSSSASSSAKGSVMSSSASSSSAAPESSAVDETP